MRPHHCPFCNKVFTFKHIGNCREAILELDENIKKQVESFKTMTDEQVEAQIKGTMHYLVQEYLKKHNSEPSKAWLANADAVLRERAKELRGK